MKIRFYGCRGSYPVPTEPARIEELTYQIWQLAQDNPGLSWENFKKHLEVSPRSKYQIFGGNTTCLELSTSKSPYPIYLDAGTGIQVASKDPESALNSKSFKANRGKAAIFFTHTHWDHIIGLPNVAQIYTFGNQFHLYGVHKKLMDRLSTLFQIEHFPVPFEIVQKNFQVHQMSLNKELDLGDLKITHFAQHHPGGSFAYRFEDGNKVFIFATDTELKMNDELMETTGQNFYSNADVLVMDSHFSPNDLVPGYGHPHSHAVIDFAVREKTKVLYLFHQNPLYSDHQLDAQLSDAKKYLQERYPTSLLKVKAPFEGESVNLETL